MVRFRALRTNQRLPLEIAPSWKTLGPSSGFAVSFSEPTKILRHAYTLNAFALMSPESYQQPPVARSGEDSALILPEVSSANRHRQMEVRHVSALNEFNAERRSKGAKAAPHQLMPTVPASTPDARRSWDGSMTLPDDATPQTSLFNRGHAQELLRDKMPTKIAGCRPTRARSTGPRSSANFPLKYRISNPPHDEWPHNASESP